LTDRSVYTALAGVMLEAVALMHDHSVIDLEVAMGLEDRRGLLACSAPGDWSGGETGNRAQRVILP